MQVKHSICRDGPDCPCTHGVHLMDCFRSVSGPWLAAGLADPVSDLRNALICKGGATKVTLTEVTFKGLGCYVWEDADAVLKDCTFNGGMHGVYAWGRCQVEISGCSINGMEKSGVCIRDGVNLSMQVCALAFMPPCPPWHCLYLTPMFPAATTSSLIDSCGDRLGPQQPDTFCSHAPACCRSCLPEVCHVGNVCMCQE